MAGAARKAREHSKKMRDKRTAKAAKRQLYASLAGSSHKQKKVARRSLSNWTGGKHKHLMTNCGNPGCPRCGTPTLPFATLKGIREASISSSGLLLYLDSHDLATVWERLISL